MLRAISYEARLCYLAREKGPSPMIQLG
uniref:Uncharacterized protein n=1 Tax=Arundo donax TaxID=35708 RepID=A0A0A9B8N8_ARUDO